MFLSMAGSAKPRRCISTRMMPGRTIPLVRLILISSVLLGVLLDTWLTKRASYLTLGILFLYLVYGGVLYLLARAHKPLVPLIARWEHWGDLCWFGLLMSFDPERSFLFFFGFSFPFLVAAFRRGLAEAVRVTALATLLYMAPILTEQIQTGRFDLDHLIVPPAMLVVLGGMVACWGGFEIALKKRLDFISGMTGFSNPRIGAPHMINSFMERLRGFYDAEACIMVMTDLGEPEVRLRRVDRSGPGAADHAVPVPKEVVSHLLSLPPEVAVVRQTRWSIGTLLRPSYFEYDVVQAQRALECRQISDKLAATLDTASFISVPLRYRNDTIGRAFLTSNRRCFDESDIHFLVQVFEHLMPLVDNIRLVERMATDAAVTERKKLARDLHDSVIQPHIGLKLGLGCLRRKLESKTLQPTDIDRLIEIDEMAIADLRRYVSVLRGRVEQDEEFLPALNRFVTTFSFATGISVEVEADQDLRVSDRLAAEAFQIVTEGLSNIRRHTDSMKARISIGRGDGRLILRITNVFSNGGKPESFVPWSITERAEALGGKVHVDPASNGGTTVTVEVPL